MPLAKTQVARRGSRYNTDPASVRGAGKLILPYTILDVPRIMQAVRDGLIEGLPPMPDPTDDMLIATVIDLGMPAWSADQMRSHPGLRLNYYLTWLDVQDAAKGNAEAKERIDAMIEYFHTARKNEQISDTPNATWSI